MAVITKATIDNFYSKKRIAVIGASRSKAKYGHMLFSELKKCGYDAVPVNPNAEAIEGVKAFKSIKDVKPAPEAVIAVVPPAQQEKVVNEVADAGIKDLWMHEHVMKGITNPAAIGLATQRGLNVIVGFCPMMFMPGSMLLHKIHGAIIKLFGAYPK